MWAAHFYILDILAQTISNLHISYLPPKGMLDNPFLNIIVGGVGAAAGSSYWHDQLDRVRDLKTLSKTFTK